MSVLCAFSWGALSIYTMTSYVPARGLFRAWDFLDVLFLFFVLLLVCTPGAVWGALGGPRPLLEGSGEILSPGKNVSSSSGSNGPSLPPPVGGSVGGPHKCLLDLLVRTDTKGGSRGSRGRSSDPLVLVRCEDCGRPLYDRRKRPNEL